MGLFGKKKEKKKEESLNEIKKEVIGKPPEAATLQQPQGGEISPPVIEVPKPPSLSPDTNNISNSMGQENGNIQQPLQDTDNTNSNLLYELDDIDKLLAGDNSKTTSDDLFTLSQEDKKEDLKKGLNFSSIDKKSSISEVLYVTTDQFKEVMETIEGIKKRIKSATDTYLRIMDIKAEEDIELENLRKDLEYIEDKLYQIDETLFN